MDPTKVAAISAAIIGVVAVVTGLWRFIRRVSASTDAWEKLIVLVDPPRGEKSITDRMSNIEASLAELVRQNGRR